MSPSLFKVYEYSYSRRVARSSNFDACARMRSTKQNHKRQKSEVFMIDDSDDSEGEGLFKRLQKRREIPAPAGLKTTGLSDDDSSDDDSSIDDGYDNRGHEKKDDDVVNKSMIQSISFSSLSGASPPRRQRKFLGSLVRPLLKIASHL